MLISLFPLLKAQRYITQLKSQINSLEAELEEQRAQKQRALVENEQLRMELEATRRRNAEHESLQTTFIEAESKPYSQYTVICTDDMCSGADINAVLSLRCAERSQATEQRYNKLKEKHTELVASHAELLRKVQTDFRPVRRCLMLHLAVCGNTKCVNVLTECRHCEDAYSDPADPGRGGEDQTAAVV